MTKSRKRAAKAKTTSAAAEQPQNKSNSSTMINTIIDIYHGNNIDLQQCFAGGMVGIIHKASRGAAIRDSKYHERRQRAKEIGFLWGAYHFSTGGAVSAQVENFLTYARPEEDELISLHWERSDGPDMTLDQARNFVQMIRNETGRWPVLYGGDLLRESIGHNPDPVLANCPLWYARYSETPMGIPLQVWPTYTLWQYTDGDDGPEPHETAGVGGADRNIFQGTTQQLKNTWPFTRREDGVAHGPGFFHILNHLPQEAAA